MASIDNQSYLQLSYVCILVLHYVYVCYYTDVRRGHHLRQQNGQNWSHFTCVDNDAWIDIAWPDFARNTDVCEAFSQPFITTIRQRRLRQ